MNETTDKLIRDLAEKLGTTAEHLWEVLVKQAWISGVTDLVITTIVGVLLVIATREFSGWRKGANRDNCDDDIAAQLGSIGVAIAWCVFVVVAANVASASVSALLNPEYWALKQIIK